MRPTALDFNRFCEHIHEISSLRSTQKKVRLFADVLQACESIEEATLAAQFVGEGVFPAKSGQRVGLGSKTVAMCVCKALDIDYEQVFKPCKTATGSSTETIALLLEHIRPVRGSWQHIGLAQLVSWAQQLQSRRQKTQKEALLDEIIDQLPPLSVRYMLRIFSQYSLRIGFEQRSVLQAIALASGSDIEAVRHAQLVGGSLTQTTRLALEGRLEEARFSPFHAMSFMLAASEKLNDAPLKGYIAEQKFDGMRAQMHLQGTTVQLFTRDLNEVSSSFPDLVQHMAAKSAETMVLDGEIVVFKENSIQPFRFLQQRMGVKKPRKKLIEDYPVRFIAYDVLYANQQECFEQPFKERRQLLEQLASNYGLLLSRQYPYGSQEELQHLFDQALAQRNEGLMLKQLDSAYAYGQRKKAWLKIKAEPETLDTVILYAHSGSGKRGGLYSDFTLGIKVEDDERYDEDFIPIGKAYGGYTDNELKKLNQQFKKIGLQRFGPTLSLQPHIVVELAFEQIMLNKRTKAGYTLRLPRFKRIRWDKSPADCNTLADVEALYKGDDGLQNHAIAENERAWIEQNP